MSWTDYFPVFDDEQIADFEQLVMPSKRAELQERCAVARRVNERPEAHRVATNLFWKKLVEEEGDLAVVSREQMMDADKLGLISRYAPRDHYVKTLLEGPMTLWRTEFSNHFHREWTSSCAFVDPRVLLQAWIDLGKARVLSTTAKSMGWSVR